MAVKVLRIDANVAAAPPNQVFPYDPDEGKRASTAGVRR